jgi:transcriptional regulator with XRE-family HTH domain
MTAKGWEGQLQALGGFIRSQRQLARMSLRELADIAHVSNPYLSQIERGLHEPSIRVLAAIAEALAIPAETLLEFAGLRGEGTDDTPGTEQAIRGDPKLSDDEKAALITVYRSYLAKHREGP